MATDACEDGKGFATAEFASSQVSFPDACQSATASASSQLYKGAGKCEGRYVADGAFEEISLPVLHGAMCGVRATGRCFCPEAIHLLEARAQIRCAIRCGRWYRNRRGYLVGQCGVRIGAEPSPRSFRLLRIVRRSCAIGPASRSKRHFRWIPTEVNPADAPFPSRLRSREKRRQGFGSQPESRQSCGRSISGL